jgi:threonine dehydratase
MIVMASQTMLPLSVAYLKTILRPTTLIDSPRLQARLGIQVTLASETFQYTGSFKFRAAYHVAATVPHSLIITASSGNYGQALAYACQLLGKKCLVVMPETSSTVKIEAVREYGGVVDLIDVERVSRQQRVNELARRHPEAYLSSAYDDPLVIAGNATLGLELSEAAGVWDAVIAPVGGGGLTAGLITGLCSAGCKTPVYGAEPLLANDAARSLRQGVLVKNEREPQTIADGTRTISLGQHNWEILKTGIKDILEVSEEAIQEAVRLLFLLANLKTEPTGALSVAALLEDPERFRGQHVCCVISGGNVAADQFCQLLVSPRRVSKTATGSPAR